MKLVLAAAHKHCRTEQLDWANEHVHTVRC
jgi:hypothetical protein